MNNSVLSLTLLTFVGGLFLSTLTAACSEPVPTAFQSSNQKKGGDDDGEGEEEGDGKEAEKPATKPKPKGTTTTKPETTTPPATPTPNPTPAPVPAPTPAPIPGPGTPPPGGDQGFACFSQCISGNQTAKTALSCEMNCQETDDACFEQCWAACGQNQACMQLVDGCDMQCGGGEGGLPPDEGF